VEILSGKPRLFRSEDVDPERQRLPLDGRGSAFFFLPRMPASSRRGPSGFGPSFFEHDGALPQPCKSPVLLKVSAIISSKTPLKFVFRCKTIHGVITTSKAFASLRSRKAASPRSITMTACGVPISWRSGCAFPTSDETRYFTPLDHAEGLLSRALPNPRVFHAGGAGRRGPSPLMSLNGRLTSLEQSHNEPKKATSLPRFYCYLTDKNSLSYSRYRLTG
jgi:hypothetical protein